MENGELVGTVGPVIWWQARTQDKKGLVKKFPFGRWMKNYKNTILLYSVLNCLLFHEELVPLHYSQAFQKVCCAQRLFVGSVCQKERGKRWLHTAWKEERSRRRESQQGVKEAGSLGEGEVG